MDGGAASEKDEAGSKVNAADHRSSLNQSALAELQG
jgi:hypothetical protein